MEHHRPARCGSGCSHTRFCEQHAGNLSVPVNPSFQTLVLDQLSRVMPAIRARPMFGGAGIYSGEIFFALIANDTVYFKVDETTRGDVEACGMGPVRAFGDDRGARKY